MATRMRVEYDKYQGTPNVINILLLIVVVLDPRCKVKYVNHFVNYLFNENQTNELTLKLSSSLKSLYEQYKGVEEDFQINQEVAQLDEEDDDDIHGMSFYLRTNRHKIDAKTKLDKYMNEDYEPFIKSINFDILT